ncbi:MAG: hypothetical protein K2X87_02315 [Gemmataceae bacterium]|nr:hypothetical protein [Gemmataceae bacterium]
MRPRAAGGRAAAVLVAALASGLPAGCGGGGPTVFPVEGRVVYNNQPAVGAVVVFHPADAPGLDAPRPTGRVQPDGTFRLRTDPAGDGAPAGEYVVTVVWPAPADRREGAARQGGDRLRGRYGDPATSQWRVRVPAQPTTLDPFTLK